VVLNAVDHSVKNAAGEETYTVPGRKYQMEGSWDVPASASVDQMIDWIATVSNGRGVKLATAVFNCHGLPGRMLIGTGIALSDVTAKFPALLGRVERIWIVACQVAKDDLGYAFCREVAVRSGASVIASASLQYDDSWFGFPTGYIDDWDGIVRSFNPDGSMSGRYA
jgi:hypothetical protein